MSYTPDSGSETSEDSDVVRYTTLGEFYDAIFREFIPPDFVLGEVYREFVQFHHEHTPKILTLAAFREHFDDVVRALDEHDFIQEYEQMFPDRPHTSTYECKRNLEGLRDAIEALGPAGIEDELDLIYSLHPVGDNVHESLNVRTPIETDIMSLVCAYIARRPLAGIHTQPGARRPPRRFFNGDVRADGDKENARPRPPAPTRPTTPTPAPADARGRTEPGQRRPHVYRARMTVAELLTQLSTL